MEGEAVIERNGRTTRKARIDDEIYLSSHGDHHGCACYDSWLTCTKRDGINEAEVSYRTVTVEGTSIFYREAGPKGAPTILLLHGLPSSSRMFQPLLTRLADKYHLVAPDYPGFGHSDWPDPKQFAYTFDHIAAVMDGFAQSLGLTRYTLYM